MKFSQGLAIPRPVMAALAKIDGDRCGYGWEQRERALRVGCPEDTALPLQSLPFSCISEGWIHSFKVGVVIFCGGVSGLNKNFEAESTNDPGMGNNPKEVAALGYQLNPPKSMI